MGRTEKLYEAFGELIYLVAKADGIIQKEETDILDEILKKHPHGNEIKWSFEYEASKQNSTEFLYEKVPEICYQMGPNPEFQSLIEILEAVANADSGVSEAESGVINNFTKELTDRFKKDLDEKGLKFKSFRA